MVKNERQILGDAEQQVRLEHKYRDRVRELGKRFNLDFHASDSIAFDHVLSVLALSGRYVDWIVEQGFLDNVQLAVLRKDVGRLLVLEEHDHKSFGTALKEKRLKDMRKMQQETIVVNFSGREANVLLADEIRQREAVLAEWQGQDVPPGNVFRLREGATIRPQIVYTNWSEEYDPYERWTLEGTVAEETLHVASNIGRTRLSVLTPAQLHGIEEVAVKYYVVEMMKGSGTGKDTVAKYATYSPQMEGSYRTWQLLRERDGNFADHLFFQGIDTDRDAVRLKSHITDCLRRGIIR